MVILGIDPGYATTGFGVVFSDRGNLKLLHYADDADISAAARSAL